MEGLHSKEHLINTIRPFDNVLHLGIVGYYVENALRHVLIPAVAGTEI